MTGYTNDESVSPATHDGRYSPLQAKQRASILWLLSKACDSVIPPDLREPFYRGHDGEDHLKPYIVQALASAELYCMALSNIYADPNYNNLSHTGIIGVLMRKGIYVQEPQDTALTESILIRTNPVKMVSTFVRVIFYPILGNHSFPYLSVFQYPSFLTSCLPIRPLPCMLSLPLSFVFAHNLSQLLTQAKLPFVCSPSCNFSRSHLFLLLTHHASCLLLDNMGNAPTCRVLTW